MAGNVPTYSGNHLLAAGVNHGNTKLWTAMWPGGVIKNDPDYVDKDGSIHMKFGWWRGVSGRLSIQGRRLDAPGPPLRAEVSDGYGDHGFQARACFSDRLGVGRVWRVAR
jgi:hypothetical protein